MFKYGINDVDYMICNTDWQALEESPIRKKIQLGPSLTEGKGAGNIPKKGKESAIESSHEIEKELEDTKMIFVTAGMGGGTGTGAAPVISKIAKDLNILTIGVVTVPFRFEGEVRFNQALEGIEEMRKYVDSLLVIDNEKLRFLYGNLKMTDAFSKADDVLTSAVKGIAEIITVHGYVNVDFADVRTVMNASGDAIMGTGIASGENRAIDAIKNSLHSPLLNSTNIRGAKNILLNVASGTEECSIEELSQITDFVQGQVGQNVQIIWGNCTDTKLENNLSVTIIATGFQSELINKTLDRKNRIEKKEIVTLKSDLNTIENKRVKPIRVVPRIEETEKLSFQNQNIEKEKITNLNTENSTLNNSNDKSIKKYVKRNKKTTDNTDQLRAFPQMPVEPERLKQRKKVIKEKKEKKKNGFIKKIGRTIVEFQKELNLTFASDTLVGDSTEENSIKEKS